ncbi:ankyrin repeat-containing domain protein [Xylaria arbuscula]|nr:ankyrin repeat-containing domain protein [Xylaria arbuscula]
MAATRLYNEALTAFKTQMLQELKPGKEHELLENFLATREAPQRAAEEASSLKAHTDKKWGDRKVGKVTVPAHWIDKIMENIQNFISVGNFVMQGAPESAGLAWLAVRLTLSAIQGNYELYSLFGTGLTDITEIMILIPHYDNLYDTGTKKTRKDSLVGILFDNIMEAYIAILRFSFEIKKRISASSITKVTHVVADFFGTSKLKFQDLLDKIKTRKSRVLEYSMAAYQDKSLEFNERQEADMESLKKTLEDMQTFNDSEKKYRDKFIAEIHAVKQSIEATNKPKTPWDIAIANFEKTKKRLSPDHSSHEPLTTALSRRFAGTCQWILEDKDFLKWYKAKSNELLWVTGKQGTGKSTLLGFVTEHLCENMDKDNTLPIYFSCESSTKSRVICNTLLYQVYIQAMGERNDLLLLEGCNAVFTNPKSTEIANTRGTESTAKTRGGITHIIGNDNTLADFAMAMPRLSTLLKRSVIVIIDAADSLPADDQRYLIDQIRTVLNTTDDPESSKFQIKVLVGCRVPLRSAYTELSVENRIQKDMKTRLSVALKSLQGISGEDIEKAADTIIQKAGPSFIYITETVIPFIRQPFQGSLDKRLELLPEPQEVSNTYSEAIQKMEPNYLDLLRVAVTWCLLAPGPRLLTVEVVMDAFRGTYESDDLGNEMLQNEHSNDLFPLASPLEKSQLEDTHGPFLDLDLDDANPSFVSIRDYNEVKDFCIEDTTHQRSHESVEGDERYVCSRCKVLVSGPKNLTVSEKSGHLAIALASLRHLNNPLFQRRAQLLSKESSVTIQEADPEKTQEQGLEDRLLETSETDQKETNDEGIVVKNSISDADATSGGDSKDNTTGDNDGAVANPVDETKESGDDAASDGSIDEEDDVPESPSSGNEEDNDPVPEFSTRYEIHYWPYHLLKAEELWSDDERAESDDWAKLFAELDRFCENTTVFGSWQRIYSYQQASTYLRSPRKPLHVASYLGLVTWARKLLDRGHDPNELSGPYSALQVGAINIPKVDLPRLLLEKGGDMNAMPGNEAPAFNMWIVRDHSVDTVKLMLKHGADPLIHDKHGGWTALHCFAWQGEDPEVLNLLLNHSSTKGSSNDINVKDKDKETPLHVLLCRKEVPTELLKAFVEHGANVNEDDCYSRRPLQLASMWGELKILEILLQHTELIDDDDTGGSTSLHFAAIHSHVKCIDLLIRKGADVSRTNGAGRTALHEAAWSGSKECIQKLLEHDADINALDTHGRNPLFYACQSGSEDTALFIIDTLLERNVALSGINKITKGLRTPLRQAASAGYEKVVLKLIDIAKEKNDIASLYLNRGDEKHGMTPLHRAAWKGYDQCVQALFHVGADAKVKDKMSRTALVLAYEKWALGHQSSYEDTISHLIDKDPLAAKNDAELLSLCASTGSIRIIRQLQELGADFSLRDKYGWTPLELARKFQRTEIEQMLKKQTAWKGHLPSRWERSDFKGTISDDGLKITYTNSTRVCVTTDRPLPAGLDDFYFEITCEPLEAEPHVEYPELAFGFCTLRGDTIEFPGWPPRDQAKSAASWAYQADDGGIFQSTGDGAAGSSDRELRYKSGDTVGCGVDHTTGRIWFTKNGELLKHSFQDVHGRLFPVIGLRKSVCVSTNFVGPFKWDSDAEHAEPKGNASITAGKPKEASI